MAKKIKTEKITIVTGAGEIIRDDRESGEALEIAIETLKEIAKGTYSQMGAVRAAKEALLKLEQGK